MRTPNRTIRPVLGGLIKRRISRWKELSDAIAEFWNPTRAR
jgi:hypothetical protein